MWIYLLIIPLLLYIFLTWNNNYWKKLSVNGPEPYLFFGSFPNFLKQKQHFAEDVDEIYRKYKETENFVGVFLLRTPQLLILDPKLAQSIFISAFKNFQDNDIAKLVDVKKDPLIAKNPFLQNFKDWKIQRHLVSPALTTTNIKAAYTVMQKVTHKLSNYIESELKKQPKDGFDGKNLAERFTCENVADSVLGIEARSFTDDPLPIPEQLKKFTENNSIFLLYTLLSGIYPNILRFYKAKFVPQSCENFFFNLMKNAYKMREDSGIVRQDFMNHLLTLKKSGKIGNDVELASHTMTFLLDGLDTTATVISHCLLFLARNTDCQDILREEIVQNIDENDDISYEVLNELPYLDACIHESIRIFPPGLFSSKCCTEPIELTNKNGSKLQLNIGDTVMIPTYSLHFDSNYYDDPEEFRPSRFMPENGGLKKYRDMGVYLGFGDGPRICLGMKFALTQTKVAIVEIIRKFYVKINPKTKPQLRLDPTKLLAMQDGGVWLDFEKLGSD